ncbi:chemotaxis protein CheW [Caulobacter segnis]|uniref:chemotaxis protein CheW n=1 Tax=Caulobacter segnis TaxID=88688 RepID=UPI0024105DCA|nr:chemotaxis protein CheW [Caulobacter segnis]MDG2521008.1 chemotaxis protein CheW [Caulobacter segnis]
MATGRTRKVKLSTGEMSPGRARRITAARAERLAVRGVEAAIAATRSVLLCETAGGLVGLSLNLVSQVAPVARIAAAPRSHPAVIGVLSHAGKLHAVLDLAVLLGAAATPATTGQILIIASAPNPTALRVDAVLGVAEVEPLADQGEGAHPLAAIRAGIGDHLGRTTALLNADALFRALQTSPSRSLTS